MIDNKKRNLNFKSSLNCKVILYIIVWNHNIQWIFALLWNFGLSLKEKIWVIFSSIYLLIGRRDSFHTKSLRKVIMKTSIKDKSDQMWKKRVGKSKNIGSGRSVVSFSDFVWDLIVWKSIIDRSLHKTLREGFVE